MSAPGSTSSYITTLLLVLVTAFAWLAITAPCIEIGFFWASVLTALGVSLYAWQRGDRIGQTTMLLIYFLLACSVTLAVTSVMDLANYSFLGKHKDAESGVMLGGLLAFCLLVVISTRLSKRFPAALGWGTLVACLMGGGCGSVYISSLMPDYTVIVTITSVVACLMAFIGLCRCKENLTDSQYLAVLSLIVFFLCMASPSTKENLSIGLSTSVIQLLAGLLFFSVRKNVPAVVFIAGVMPLYIGFTSVIQDVLIKVLGVNEIAAGIPALFFSFLVLVWSRYRKAELPRGLYGVSLFTFGFLGIYCILPENFSDSLAQALIASIMLFILACMWFAPSPLQPMKLNWRIRSRNTAVACCFMFAMTAAGVLFMLSINILADNSSPARLIAILKNTPFWPGDKTFVRLAMRDESLWADSVRKEPQHDINFEDYLDVIRPVNDRFSYVSNTSDYKNEDCGFSEGLGINWKRVKDRVEVLQVNQRSSAGLAGLIRGESIVAINGIQVRDFNKLDDKDWDRLFGGWKAGTVVALDVLASSGKNRRVSMKIGYDIQDPPLSRIITTSHGHQIGYLYLGSFNMDQFENIREHFSGFKKNGINDLVLDLRYNSGGNLINAWRLGNLIAGQVHDGKQFLRLEHSPRYEDLNVEYIITTLPESINIRRLVVLTTKETCSASEVVINALKPYLPVSTVGSTTCGKPYSMSPIEFGENTLMPLTAKVVNARGEGDYTKGIRPDYRVVDDLTHQLGDPQEAMLKKTIELIENCHNNWEDK